MPDAAPTPSPVPAPVPAHELRAAVVNVRDLAILAGRAGMRDVAVAVQDLETLLRGLPHFEGESRRVYGVDLPMTAMDAPSAEQAGRAVLAALAAIGAEAGTVDIVDARTGEITTVGAEARDGDSHGDSHGGGRG